jgi:nitrogen fixation protein FixH
MSFALPSEIRGTHVFIALAGFFGLMLLANAAFLYFALSTFDRPQSNAYESGLHYNARIDAAKAQAALGWSHRLAIAADGEVTLTVTARDGSPVRSLAVTGVIGRPAADRFSQQLAFREMSDGTYAAPTVQLEPGTWIVSIDARKPTANGSEPAYQLKERLWLAPRQ